MYGIPHFGIRSLQGVVIMATLLFINLALTLGLGSWMFSLARRVQLLSPSKADSSTPDPNQTKISDWTEEE
jgi:hypothetical protein